jgi:hypothetical protein
MEPFFPKLALKLEYETKDTYIGKHLTHLKAKEGS